MTDVSANPLGPRSAEIQKALGKLERAAHASIRGYLTQIVYTALQWLDLSDNEVIVVEGREDLDRFILDPNGAVRQVNEVQLKDLAEAVNARSEAVWESIFNFLLSHKHHQDAGRHACMLFVTTASLKAQSVAESTGLRQTEKTTRLDLEVDVARTWSSLSEMDEAARSVAVEKLARAVRGLFDAHLRPLLPKSPSETTSAESQRAASVLSVIDLHDESSTWLDFFSSVSWVPELDSASEMAEQLEQRLASAHSLSALPSKEFAQVLIYRVLLAAAQAQVTERFLTREALRSICSESEESLRQWAEKVGLVNLKEWERGVWNKLVEHEQRLDDLEGTVADALPSMARAWKSIATFSDAARRRIRVEIGGIHVQRHAPLDEVHNRVNSAGVLVLLGDSGVGKSALVREYTEALDAKGGLTLWLGGASFERPDLAALCSDFGIGTSLEAVLDAYDGSKTLVLDGLDRVYEQSARVLAADVLRAVRIETAEPLCRVVITCQSAGWRGLEDFLRQERIDTSVWSVHECKRPDLAELKSVWDAIPAARRIAYEPRLSTLMRNLKVLDLVATRIKRGDVPDPDRFVGESSVASWFWGNDVVTGSSRRQRDMLTMRLAEKQADELRLSISLADLGISEAGVLDGLEAGGVCVVDERNHILFAHDLFGDWARLRALKMHTDDLIEYLAGRFGSPLWHRAIRLLGAQLLDEHDDVVGWSDLYRRLQKAGGNSISDLLLESVVFAANSRRHLQLLGNTLLTSDEGLLDRLLARFVAFATLPDPQMGAIGRSVGMSDAKAAALYRYPNWPYWPAVLEFLHANSERVVNVASRRCAQVVRLWLDHTRPRTMLRTEAGELALALGRMAMGSRSSIRDGREELFATALAAVPECEADVVAFALEACERTTVQKEDARHFSIIDQMHPEFDPNEPMPEPAPDGPRNRVDDDLQHAVLFGGALGPIMRCRPDVAREVVLACLLASRHRGDRYRDDIDEWRADLAFTRGSWSPPGPFRGPFKRLLQEDFDEGLETVIRLVDFVTQRLRERAQNRAGVAEQDGGGDDALTLEVGKVPRTFVGGRGVLGWAAGLGAPLPNERVTSALMALEEHFYEALGSDRDVPGMLHAMLNRATSVAFLHVALDVGRKDPALFEGPLMPLLAVPELYFAEIEIQAQGRGHLTLFSALEGEAVMKLLHGFNSLEHRRHDLRRIAAELFVTNDNVREFLAANAERWSEALNDLQPGRWRDLLKQLVLMFDLENYAPARFTDGSVGYVNVALQEHDLNLREERAAHDEAVRIGFLPVRCRQMIDDGTQIPEDELPDFVELLKRVESAWRGATTNSNPTGDAGSRMQEMYRSFAAQEPANALAGGIAVLVCLHWTWVEARPELRRWCQTNLVELVKAPPAPAVMDVSESASTWSWDCFAAEAGAALWSQSPRDQVLRELVARMVFAPHYRGGWSPPATVREAGCRALPRSSVVTEARV